MLSVIEAYRSDKDILLASYSELYKRVSKLNDDVKKAKDLLDEADTMLSATNPDTSWKNNYRRFAEKVLV